MRTEQSANQVQLVVFKWEIVVNEHQDKNHMVTSLI